MDPETHGIIHGALRESEEKRGAARDSNERVEEVEQRLQNREKNYEDNR
jgi:hypothetical protein